MLEYLPHISLVALWQIFVLVVVIPWVLLTKKDATAATAWCLAVLLMPVFGTLLFWVFGYNYIHRLVRRKRRHRLRFREAHPPKNPEAIRGDGQAAKEASDDLGQLALRVRAFPVSHGNAVTLYHDTQNAFDALLASIEQARGHVHLEYFIVRNDDTGCRLINLLARKAREGVEVRFLFDALGSLHLKRRTLQPLVDAGGKVAAFLPVNPVRSLLHFNLRNHRKITVIDGRVGFTGGMNIGDEYLGKNPYYGYWRDGFLRVEGPAAAGLQRVFCEDWDFAADEGLPSETYFPRVESIGAATVQIAESGPDQEMNCIREIYLMAILSARDRLWIASPYFVPDNGILDALRVASYRGVDVRLLSLLRPDHYISYFAGRYFWKDMIDIGAKVYQYRRGMMHSKVMMVDGRWAMVGSANLDNRSLHLNFEVGCALHTPALVADLEAAFLRDLQDATEVTLTTLTGRNVAVRVLENACRLLAPNL